MASVYVIRAHGTSDDVSAVDVHGVPPSVCKRSRSGEWCRKTCLMEASATSHRSSIERTKDHSASSIQNSARCLEVCERSARKQGERVQTRATAFERASRCNCDDTVRYDGLLKNSVLSAVTPRSAKRDGTGARRKDSPAPS